MWIGDTWLIIAIRAVLLIRIIIPVQLCQTDHKRTQHEEEYEAELCHIHQHTAQGDLQGTQVRVSLEQVDDAGEAAIVGWLTD